MGNANIPTGEHYVAVGADALQYDTTGAHNVVVGEILECK
jgi:hypothetical protein